jgi:co-chaperonin GroES (HSP10)
MAGNLRPLRGRVAIRPVVETRIGRIHLPDYQPEWDRRDQRSAGIHARSSHRGHVLAMGAPAERYGHPVAHGFCVGDEVVFVFASGGTEESRRSYYGEEPCVWVTQEEVLAVVETRPLPPCGIPHQYATAGYCQWCGDLGP